MAKIKLLIELEYDAGIMHANDDAALYWFFKELLVGDDLLLHSNEIGDVVGRVKVLSINLEDIIQRLGKDENNVLLST